MAKTGNIPEKLKLFIRPEAEVSWRWEDVEDGGIEFKVRPTYISDAKNKKTCETGHAWANHSSWNSKTQEHEDPDPQVVDVDNVPFSGLQIVTLEIRDKGGRAYKVRAKLGGVENVYFDMREDVLLDCLFEGIVGKSGIIDAEFVIARVGSQMKPVRVGSLLHDKMIEATKMDKQKAIVSLEIGGVYESKSGERGVFLGEFWTWQVKNPISPDRKCDYGRNYEYLRYGGLDGGGHYKYHIDNLELVKPVKVKLFNTDSNATSLEAPSKHSVDDGWFYTETEKEHRWNKDSKDAAYPRYKKGDVIDSHNLKLAKSHSYKKKVGKVKIPLNWVENMQKSLEDDNANCKTYVNLVKAEKGPILCLSKTKGHVHSIMTPYVK